MADYILGTASTEAANKLDQLQVLANQAQTQIFNAGAPNQRMLMFAFDGTWNNKNDPSLGPVTNVARLFEAADKGLKANDDGAAFYYPGAGTQGNGFTNLIDGATGASIPETVATAYKDLVNYANQNPTLDITIGTTGFSRGAAAARAFLNTVWDQGIPDTSSRVSLGVDSSTGQERFGYTRYLVEPQEANLGIAMLYDTVATGVARQDVLLRIPPAAGLKVF